MPHTHHQTGVARLQRKRNLLWQYQAECCFYCDSKIEKEEATLDHIIPQSKGGTNNWNNLIVCCKKCNWKKGTKGFIRFLYSCSEKSISDKMNELREIRNQIALHQTALQRRNK